MPEEKKRIMVTLPMEVLDVIMEEDFAMYKSPGLAIREYLVNQFSAKVRMAKILKGDEDE